MIGILRIPRDVLDRIARAAELAYPAEACGFLVGRGDEVSEAVPAPNRAERPDRYLIDARDVWKAMKVARDDGHELLGVYHSHPDGEPEPSTTDVDDAWGAWVHLIVACGAGKAAGARAWSFREGEFRPLELVESDGRQPGR